MGNEGEAFKRTPIAPSASVATTMKAAATSAFSTLDGTIVKSGARDRPTIVMIKSFQRVFICSPQFSRAQFAPLPRWSDQVATPNVDLVYCSSTAVRWSERALLDRADDMDVFALFVRCRHVGDFVVED